MEDVWRVSPHEGPYPRVGEYHATGHAFGVRTRFYFEVKLRKVDNNDSGVRPFGVSLLVAGWDINRGSTLYQVDPSGSYWAWKASAIGKNMVNAKTFLEKRSVFRSLCFSQDRTSDLDSNSYNDDISLEDAIHTALLTLKEGFEGQMTEKTIEIGVVTVPTEEDLEGWSISSANSRPKSTFRKLTEEEVRDYLAL